MKIPFSENYEKAKANAEKFEGMMGNSSIAIFQAFLDLQHEKSIYGDLVEFGVYKGRSASVLLSNLRDAESATLVDIADYPELDKLAQISNRFEFIKGKSEDLVNRPDFHTKMDRTFRFSHHDASHSFHNVEAEMAFMQDRIAPRGILVLDDFGNPSYFQVVAACFSHLRKSENRLKFLLYSSNKAYLCLEEDFPFYEDFVANHILPLINGVGFNFYLTRTEKSGDYAGFSLFPKPNKDHPDLYGVKIYGMRYYTVPPFSG